MPAIHHSVIVVRDLEASLRFYRDCIGLDVLLDREVEGDWPGLLGATSTSLRAVFLGRAGVPDDYAGVLELNVIEGATVTPPADGPRTGLAMLSYFVDVNATLARLAHAGLGGTARIIQQPTPSGPITLATVTDPDGVTILLTPGSITQSSSSHTA